MAQDLPITLYTPEQGLAHERIKKIVADSKGFLWFCTSGGASRFDGTTFMNIGADQGLPVQSVNDILENADGSYWLATNGGGLALLGGPDRSRMKVLHPNGNSAADRINVLLRDRNGAVWMGTDGGLFRMDKGNAIALVVLALPNHSDEALQVWSLMQDMTGNVWVGTRGGLVQLLPSGRRLHYPVEPKRATDDVFAILEDSQQRVWVGHQSGLFVFRPPQDAQDREHGLQHMMPDLRDSATSLALSADGHIWIGTGHSGLFESDGGRPHHVETNPAWSGLPISAIAEDRSSNLWIGTYSNGVARGRRNGITAFGNAVNPVSMLVEDREGEIIAAGGALQISTYDGHGFRATTLQLAGVPHSTWSSDRSLMQDHAGDWWVASRIGVFRFGPVRSAHEIARARPKALYSTEMGLSNPHATDLFEDSRGDVWIGSFNAGPTVLSRWTRSTGRFQSFGAADGLPAGTAVSAMAEDRRGTIWVGLREGGAARFQDGRFRSLGPKDGFPEGSVRTFLIDRDGRLWCAIGEKGLVRFDRLDGSNLSGVWFSEKNGLSSNVVLALADDGKGNVYVGGSRGMDRIGKAEILHYSAADGLPRGEIHTIHVDRTGTVWVGALQGLSRLHPSSHSRAVPGPMLLSGLRIAGVEYGILPGGVRELVLGDLAPERNSLEIEFTRVNFTTGDGARFESRLVGSDDQWSRPTSLRSTRYAGLAAGRYRFEVRSSSAEPPAVLSFRILSPFWRTSWFLTSTGLLLAAMLLIFWRYRSRRIRQLRESEARFRTLAETASDAIVTVDEHGNVSFANLATERMFGYAAKELIGCELAMLMPARFGERHREGSRQYRETVSPEPPGAIELIGIHRDGAEIPIEVSFGAFRSEGMQYLTGIIRDLRERKQAEEALARSRVERLAELERVRRGIATDLHDDVGSSLAQISMLSDLAQRNSSADDSVRKPLERIGDSARELMESMSDIVWAINPQRDHLIDLAQRMRRFASDTLSASGIEFRLSLPRAELKVEGNLRREIFLIFKESVNNMAKHSGCSEAVMELVVEPAGLRLMIVDNGNGFDLGQQFDGHGLESMRARATAIGARFDLSSQPGVGTRIELQIPLTTTNICSDAASAAH